MVGTKKKYVAVQNGCNNHIWDDDKFPITLKEIERVVETAIENDCDGFDEDEGDVVVYELVKVKTATNPNKAKSNVEWTKA